MIYDNIKSHKKAGLHPLFGRCIFGKTTWGEEGSNDLPPPPPAFLGLTEIDHRCHCYQGTQAWVKVIEFRFIQDMR